jgi:two-component sensor histidine kinase
LLDTLALQKGFFRSLPAPVPMNQIKFYGKQVLDFLPDKDGYCWIVMAGEKGVLRIDPEGGSRFFHIITNNFISLLEDKDGNIWIPGDAGFYKYYNKYNDFFSEDEGLPSEYITGITVDEKSGGTWLANRKGISCIYQNQVFNFPYPNGESVWSTLTTNADSLWLINNGLFLYKISYQPNPAVRLIKKWEPGWRPDDFVDYTSFSKDNNGTVFLNKNSAGLFYVGTNGQLKKIYNAGLSTFFIDNNELWTSEPFSNVTRWKIIRDKDSLHLQLLQRYTRLEGNVIRCIAKDSVGNLWMGTTYKGVLKFERQKNDSFVVRNYGSQNGLMNPWVLRISINHKGEIFAGTMGGVFQIHSNGDSVYVEDLSARFGNIYTAWDIAQDKKENFWLATPMGAVHVRNDLYKKTPSPNVFFTGLLINNHPDSIIFKRGTGNYKYNENSLTFEFSTASFRNEDKVLYSYQLVKGNDSSGWSIPQHIHAVSLVSLSPGNYTMKLKAVTEETVWSRSPVEYRFVIKPPFWATWWFRFLAICAIGAMGYFFYRYRINQLKKLFAVRTKISRDLHDEIGSTLSGIGLISEMAKQQLENKRSIELKTSLDKISDNSEEMLGRMSDIVWAINPGNDSFEKVIKRLKAYAKNTTDSLGIYLHFNSEKDIEKYNLDMQKRSNIFLICKEAINNAIKYSECQNLSFALRLIDQHININIADDGKGFNMYQEFEGNGLKNMQSRAQEINADLKMNSENGKGTSISLSIKIS